MVAHQVGKAMEEAACGSKRTNAASRVVKPTGGDYKHTSPAPRAQDGSVFAGREFLNRMPNDTGSQRFQRRGQFAQQSGDVVASVVAVNRDPQAAGVRHEMDALRT